MTGNTPFRIAHATDVHWYVPPALKQIPGKRTLGMASLHLRGRIHHFDRNVQSQLVTQIREMSPDLVIITGDLTSLATPEEFEVARTELQPILDNHTVFIQPGNHDVYTVGSARDHRFDRYFGQHSHSNHTKAVARLDHGPVTVLGLNPCRPHWSASGFVPDGQLNELVEQLNDPTLRERFVILAMHYPIVDKRGQSYNNAFHGLRNAEALHAALLRASHSPDLIIHGHKHQGYASSIDVNGKKVPTLNPGSSGYAFDPEISRHASFGWYQIFPDSEFSSERWVHNGSVFEPSSFPTGT